MWVKLEEHSDWGNIYFAFPGRGLRGPFGTADQKLGIRLNKGDRIRVRWPDLWITEEYIVNKIVSSDVSDHGNSYKVESLLHGFETTVHGITFWVRLSEVEVWTDNGHVMVLL